MRGAPVTATGAVVLVVARDVDYRATLVDALTSLGFVVRACADRFEASHLFASFRPERHRQGRAGDRDLRSVPGAERRAGW